MFSRWYFEALCSDCSLMNEIQINAKIVQLQIRFLFFIFLFEIQINAKIMQIRFILFILLFIYLFTYIIRESLRMASNCLIFFCYI